MNRAGQLILVLLLGLVAIFIQGSLIRPFLPDFLVPNFIVSLTVFLAFYENSPFGSLLAFLLGMELDLYGGSPLLIGPSAGALVLVYGVLASVSQRVYVESNFAIFVMSALSAALFTIIYSILIFEFNDSAAKYFSLSLSNAFVTGLLTPLVFKTLNKFVWAKGLAQHAGHNKGSRQRSGSYKVKNV